MTSSRRDFLRTAVLLSAAAPLAAAGCSTTDPEKEKTGGGTLQKAKDSGTITVGFANEAPYGYTDKSGKLTGEAPELARAIFKNLGIDEIKGVQVDFGGLIGGLNAKRFDAIAAGMFITPERCASAAFANPEYVAKSAFMVPEGNPKGLKAAEDPGKKGVKVGVLTGAVEAGYAEKTGVKKGDIKTFADQASAYEGLKAGRIDCIWLTRISLADLLTKHKGEGFEVTDAFTPVIDGKEQLGAGAFAFRKADTDLVNAWNGELAKLQQGNKLLPILQPFGFTQAEMPGPDDTAAKFCQG
ncbi:ectoine/hydroxyectoine ABC transporter substrate-binding protein EhuB [Actinomadura citrea]|jgi:polar amino acid transport system substrate-binding protein|uniref:Polar amino acid transport system substrate-binding protein n=1 Tax=Actinomadura citrea TaxID=46158 RepID=A0A7Y9GAC8_9ACTN|nr:ectoine/hydroxyectoine ABC transporter substrate-binding protein EhuB [Actinomadura citrea]NYE12823.1 polar amino acid transport system substrate-binding protein [Actinomadura citrea]GGT54737.1 ectoine/hydroxyectoine ABC transporter substrate-binding protein EhuB [Actinomadura citrea]